MTYEHTQVVPTKTFAPVTIGAALLSLAVPGGFIARALTLGAFGCIAATFRSLTVQVADGTVTLKFGEGWFNKVISLKNITECKAIRTTIMSGWGIHYVGDGWLYNVYGLDAVALIDTDGKRTLVGTDEPEALVEAINAELERNTTVVNAE